jgi:uncharacterized membrane protein YphA (DoxX/SURF4 family)
VTATAIRPRTGGNSTGQAGIALRVLGICIGAFFIGMALNKVGWLTNSNLLLDRFVRWAPKARPAVRWYLETLAIPGAPIFARVIPIAEFSTGIALIVGFWPRLAAALALVMILNFHFATASFWSWEFLRDGTGPPLIGGLLALAIAGGRMPWTVRS